MSSGSGRASSSSTSDVKIERISAGALGGMAKELLDEISEAQRQWDARSDDERRDIAYAVRSELLRLTENVDVWIRDSVISSGDQLRVSIRLVWDDLLARKRDRARAVREARESLVRIRMELDEHVA